MTPACPHCHDTGIVTRPVKSLDWVSDPYSYNTAPVAGQAEVSDRQTHYRLLGSDGKHIPLPPPEPFGFDLRGKK